MKDEHLNLLVPAELKDRIVSLAREKKLSINETVNQILFNALADDPGVQDPEKIERLYSVKDAARLLHLSEPTIYNWIRSGRLKAEKVGKGWRITRNELRRKR